MTATTLTSAPSHSVLHLMASHKASQATLQSRVMIQLCLILWGWLQRILQVSWHCLTCQHLEESCLKSWWAVAGTRNISWLLLPMLWHSHAGLIMWVKVI